MSNTKTTDQERNPSRWRLPIILIVIAITAALLLFIYNLYVSNQKNAIWTERITTMRDRSEKVATIVSTTEEAVWPLVNMEAEIINSGQFQTTDELRAELVKIVRTSVYKYSCALAIDEDGKYLASDGGSAALGNVDFLLDVLDYGSGTALINLPHMGNQKEYIAFIVPAEGIIQANHMNIMFAALCIDADEFGQKLNVTGNQTGSDTIIVRFDGRRVFSSNTQKNNLLNGYNLFSELRKCTFTQGSADVLIDAIKNGRISVAEFKENGIEYLISTGSGTKDWSIMNITRTDTIGTSIADYMQTTTLYLSVIFIVIFLLLGGLGIMLYRQYKDRMKHEKEEMEKESLRQIAEKEKAASAAKTEFLSNMSHDIRTPINGIMGMTTIAKRHLGDSNPAVKECLDKIDGASNHLLSLINDVLDMSRIERGKTQIAHEPMDIVALAENCGSIIQGQMQGRDLDFVCDTSGVINRFVIGDELHIRQILINILGNAVKFTPDGGYIRFMLAETSEDDFNLYTFTIADNGIGMKPDFVKNIFEPFSQEDGGARTKYKGTGLGMAITKQFVDLMGGSIEVESVYNKGSTFTVTVPLMADDTHVEEEQDEVIVDLNGLRILLVEDNELNQEIAQDILEEEGATVEVADNGQVAVDKFIGNPPDTYDLILMDVMMPVMDGLEATRQIRASAREDGRTIPILAMTANAFEEDKRKVLEAGMNAHLSKPIQLDQLFREISNHVKRKGD